MKRLLVILLVIISMSAFAIAQSNRRSSNATAEAEIKQLLEDWNKAYLSGDKSLFDRIVADDWMITLSNGKVVENAKAEEMSDIMPLDSSYILRNDEVKVRIYDGNTAIVSRLITDKGKYMDRNIDRISRSTDVFVKRKGRWQVISTHLTNIAPQVKSN